MRKCKKACFNQKSAIAPVLEQIEKLVDGKLTNLKVFFPLVFTVITSLVAFLFLSDFGATENNGRSQMLVLGVILVAFAAMIISIRIVPFYKAREKKKKIPEFAPHNLDSYLYISDESFIKCIAEYVGNNLTNSDLLYIHMVKQRINELAYRKKWIGIAFWILIIGTGVIAAICILYGLGVISVTAA